MKLARGQVWILRSRNKWRRKGPRPVTLIEDRGDGWWWASLPNGERVPLDTGCLYPCDYVGEEEK